MNIQSFARAGAGHDAVLDSIEDGNSDFDVVIVGTGMGGAAVAYRLAGTGAKVLVIERGVPPEVAERQKNTFLYDVQKVGQEFKIIGGKSKFYGAALYRYRESDFEAREMDGGVSPGWPISYGDLEPYYGEAERLYRVHGGPEGDPTEPPRSAPYPHAPLPHDPLMARLTGKLEKIDVPTAPIPRGVDYGPGGSCVLCSGCDVHYCYRDAKMDADTATLRPALSAGNVKPDLRRRCPKGPHGPKAENGPRAC